MKWCSTCLIYKSMQEISKSNNNIKFGVNLKVWQSFCRCTVNQQLRAMLMERGKPLVAVCPCIIL